MPDGTTVYRVAANFLKSAGYFNVGDIALYGKYKNKRAIIKGIGVDDRGIPVVTLEPIPKGRKQDKVLGLFNIWHADPEKRRGMTASIICGGKPMPLVKTLIALMGMAQESGDSWTYWFARGLKKTVEFHLARNAHKHPLTALQISKLDKKLSEYGLPEPVHPWAV